MLKKKLIVIFIIFGIFIIFKNFVFAENSNKNFLVKINGKNFYSKDFNIWWEYWKSKDTPFPKSPQPFIDWILLSNEAKKLGLDKEISYKKKLKTFIEVRSLLQLRYDEVEKKIDINPDKLWDFYEKEFTPMIKIKAILSDNFKEINDLKKKIKNKNKFYYYFKKLKEKNKVKDLGWQRPINIPKIFKEKVLSAKKEDIIGPLKYKGFYYILLIEDIFGATKLDFNKIHKTLAVRFKKHEEERLTKNLIDQLKKKYVIKINWDIIKKISPNKKLDKKTSKKAVITIQDKTLNAEQFQKMLVRDVLLRNKNSSITKEKLDKYKKNIVNSVINQTITSIEAINRHYENNVMKDIFWFYKRNRLITELQNKIIAPLVKVTKKEIKEYYINNKNQFEKPAIVEIAVIQTQDKKLIKTAFQRIRKGEDFFEVARDIQFHGALPEKRKVDELVPEVRKVIKRLKPGRISNIIRYKKWYFIVKLIKKERKKVHEFKKVEKSIEKYLYKEKLRMAKENYLKKLREKSTVLINNSEWDKLVENIKNQKVDQARGN